MIIHAVILAGGQARRMGGGDKALLPLAGQPLIAHVIARLQGQVAGLMISANGDAARFAGFGLPVLADAVPMGPLSGILAGLRHAAGRGGDALLSVPVDSPFLPADLVARLASPGGLTYAEAGRGHYATALWPVALLHPLEAFLASGANPKIMDFAAAHGARPVAFPDPAAFDNLNTAEDLQAAAMRMGAA